MLHCDLIHVHKEGITIPAQNLGSVGIYDGSACWGLVVPRGARPTDADAHPFNLIISPFHPNCWPFLLRLKLYLADQRGALADASAALAKVGLSFLLSECVPDAIWYVIAKFSTDDGPVHTTIENYEQQYFRAVDAHPYPETGERDDATLEHILAASAVQTGRFAALADMVRKYIRALDEKNRATKQPGFLRRAVLDQCLNILTEPVLRSTGMHNKPLQNASLLDHKELKDALTSVSEHAAATDIEVGAQCQDLKVPPEFLREEKDFWSNERIWLRQFPSPIECSWMSRLAKHHMHAVSPRRPIQFTFHAPSSTLRLQGEWPPVMALPPRPAVGMCVSHARDKYLRLQVFADSRLPELHRIDIGFRVRGDTHWPLSPPGLLASVAESLRSDANVIQQSQKTTRSSATAEDELISLIALGSSERIDGKLKSCLSMPPWEGHEANWRIRPLPRIRVFLSSRQDLFRPENGLFQVLKQQAEANGMLAVLVNTNVEDITRSVANEVRSCDCLLQVLYLLDDEDPERVAFEWLSCEYGIATGCGLKTLRMVDTSRQPRSWWVQKISTGRDQSLLSFSRAQRDDEVGRAFGQALQQLKESVVNRST